MTGPVGGLFVTLLNAMSASSEFSVFIDDEQKRRVLMGLFESYYGPVAGEVIFDTNRMWCARLWAVAELLPDAKVICSVRNVTWIMDSFERAIRRNPLEVSNLFKDENDRGTVYARVETLGQRNRPVGYAWSALKEAYYGEQSDRLLLVDYELLAKQPARTVELIYEFLGESPFAHDFDVVEYEAKAFDERLGTPGMHRVSGKVQFKPRRTILPPDLFERYADMSFWHDRKATKASVIADKEPKRPRTTEVTVEPKPGGAPVPIFPGPGEDE